MNKEPLVSQGWVRAAIFLALLAGMYFLLGSLLQYSDLLPGNAEADDVESTPDAQGYAMLFAISSVISVMMVYLFRTFLDRRSFASLGLQRKNYLHDALTGLFLPVAILCLGSFFLFLNDNLQWLDVEFNGETLALWILTMAMIAVSEELVFRGYILNNLLQSFPKKPALLLSAAAFTLFHMNNPGITILSVAGLLCGGLLLGINYLYTKNLWYAILFHFTWNLLQGPILGYEVSGLQLNALLIQDLKGNPVLTGGTFGFEASLISIILCLLAVSVLYLVYEKKAKPARVRKKRVR